MAPFGQVVPVTGPLTGFPGKISRLGERVVRAAQVLSTTPNNINFGDPVVIIPTSGGGDTIVSVKDYVGTGTGQQSGTMTAAKLAGFAIAEVETMLTFPGTLTAPTNQNGYYAPGLMAEFLERGSLTVTINNGTPASQGQVYVRVTANASFPNGVVGGLEASVSDSSSNCIALTGVVFRTGVLDSNNNAEITILSRPAA